MPRRSDTESAEPLLGAYEADGASSSPLHAALDGKEPAGCLHGSVKSEIQPACRSLKVSLFDDCDIVHGIPRTTLNIRSVPALNDCKFSSNGCKMVVINATHTQIQVLNIFNRDPPELLDFGEHEVDAFSFQGDSDNVILCGYKDGRLIKWERGQDKQWSTAADYALPSACLADQFYFAISNNGQYVAVVHEAGASQYFIGVCEICSNPDAVKEVNGIELNVKYPPMRLEFSPNAHGLLWAGVLEATVLPDCMSRDVACALNGWDAYWLQDGIVVASTTEQTRLWNVDACLGSRNEAPKPGLLMTFKKEPDHMYKDHIVGSIESRVYVNERPQIAAWDVASGSVLGRVPCWIRKKCVSQNKKWMAMLEDDGRLSVWDANRLVKCWETQYPVELLDSTVMLCPVASAEGSKFILCGEDGDTFCHVYHVGDVFETDSELGHEQALAMPPDFGNLKTILCSYDNKIGVLSHSGTVLIWTLGTNDVVRIVGKAGELEDFWLSVHGNKVVTLSGEGVLALWNIGRKSGTVTDCKEICNVKELVSMDTGIAGARVSGISLTRDKAGSDVFVVFGLDCHRFYWIDLEGVVAYIAQINAQDSCQRRFSADGEHCVVLCKNEQKVVAQVWDMVNRKEVNRLEFGIDSTVLPLRFHAKDVAMDGSRIFCGIQQNGVPVVIDGGDPMPHNTTRGFGILSEDGQCAVVHTLTGDYMRSLTMYRSEASTTAAFKACTSIGFQDDGRWGEVLLFHNGERIAYATGHKIRVWSLPSDNRCIPTYDMLKVREQTHDPESLRSLLEKHGQRFLMFPNGDGWTLLARAIDDGNTEWVRMIMEWAKGNNEHIPMNRSNLTRQEDWTDLLELSVNARLPECVHVLVDEALDGTLVAPNKEDILRRVLGKMAKVYPSIVVGALSDPRMLQETGETWYSQSTLEKRGFVVCTSDEMHPENLRKLWSKPNPVLARNKIWGLLKRMNMVNEVKKTPNMGREVPAKSYVVPIADFAQIGQGGLLNRLFGRGLDHNLYKGLPMKALVSFKWHSYGQALVYDDFFSFCLLLCFFTIYSLFIGLACRHPDGLTGMLDIAPTFFLVLAMAMSGLGLFWELKQMQTYRRESRGIWVYWKNGKWNALEFLAYILIVICMPIFHFGSDPCKHAWGVSWAVPLIDILLWWRVLYYAQAFRSTGPIVLMIIAIMQDISYFLLIGLGVLLGFGIGFFVLFRADDEDTFGNVWKSLLATFAMMLGDIDLGILYNSHAPFMAVALFVSYIMIMAIVLLNLLIAIMGDSFDRIKESEDLQFHMVRAAIIDNMEAMSPSSTQLAIKQGIKRYLHILVPKDHIEEVGEWYGRMMELKNHFEKIVKQFETKQMQRMDAIQRAVEERLDDFEKSKKQQDIAMEEKLNAVLDIMKASVGEFRD